MFNYHGKIILKEVESVFLVLLAFWLILNGKITAEIVLVGVAVSAALTAMWHKIFHNKQNTIFLSPAVLWRYLRYGANLVIEIFRCNFQVMHLILHPKEEIKPQLVTFRTNLKKDSHKVILANSITLTPGTITVGVQDDLIRVHGLDASFLEGIESCDMVKRLEKMEEDSKDV